MRWLRVLELKPFVIDLILGSSRCGRIIAAFNAALEFGFFLLMTAAAVSVIIKNGNRFGLA